MDNRELLATLKQVPETRISIFDLTRQTLNSAGRIDPDKAISAADRLESAIQEAEIYRKQTVKFREHLRRTLHPLR